MLHLKIIISLCLIILAYMIIKSQNKNKRSFTIMAISIFVVFSVQDDIYNMSDYTNNIDCLIQGIKDGYSS